MFTKEIFAGLSILLLSIVLSATAFAAESGEGGFNSLLDQMGNPIQVESQMDATHAQASPADNAQDEVQQEKPRVLCATAANYDYRNEPGRINCWDLTTGS